MSPGPAAPVLLLHLRASVTRHRRPGAGQPRHGQDLRTPPALPLRSRTDWGLRLRSCAAAAASARCSCSTPPGTQACPARSGIGPACGGLVRGMPPRELAAGVGWPTPASGGGEADAVRLGGHGGRRPPDDGGSRRRWRELACRADRKARAHQSRRILPTPPHSPTFSAGCFYACECGLV